MVKRGAENGQRNRGARIEEQNLAGVVSAGKDVAVRHEFGYINVEIRPRST